MFFSRDEQIKWELNLYPQEFEDEGLSSVYLVNLEAPESIPTLTATFEISLLNAQQEVLINRHIPLHTFTEQESSEGTSLLGYNELIGRLLPTDQLHIHCKVVYETKKRTLSGSSFHGMPSLSSGSSSSLEAGSLASRFQDLFNAGMQFSDMEIRSGGNVFPVHKVVLATGSPVFAAMLQSEGFTENQTNSLNIDDLEPPVVKEMLRFLYTDRVEKMDEFAKDLLVASDKYLIDLLKTKCEAALCKTLTVENCSELLVIADTHSAPFLKHDAIDFILLHSADVVKTGGWELMKQLQPRLGLEVSDALMTHTASIAPAVNAVAAPQVGDDDYYYEELDEPNAGYFDDGEMYLDEYDEGY